MRILRIFATGIMCCMVIPSVAQHPYIMIDQFGYRPGDEKIAVLADPIIGYNAADNYVPGKILQVRRVTDSAIVFSGHPMEWNKGIIQESSGDRGWWFDFTAVTATDDYYIYDSTNNICSYSFTIADDVYASLLKTAVKMFYYNRCNYPKRTPWADKAWADSASHLGPGQDAEARFAGDKDNQATAKDMHGGWFDAGDYNKYVTFACDPIHVLLTCYTQVPAVFTDDFNIPESGNGIPDLLDELKWEIDWMKRMQESDGGVYIKIGYIDYNVPAPPSADRRPRYYGPKCSSSTITAAGVFAHAAMVYSYFPAFSDEVTELHDRAIKAWKWFHANPGSESCDNQEIKSGDADMPLVQQEQLALTAAIYLFALTNDPEYHNYIRAHFRQAREFVIPESAVYNPAQGDALLLYSQLVVADDSIKNSILAQRIHDALELPFCGYTITDDLYRAFMPQKQYTWGSNNARACIGNVNFDMILYSLDTLRHSKYYQHSINQLHYFHGVNPLNFVYISNVFSLGAENCARHIWGDWYSCYTPWADNPPPGYVTGGPNRFYNGTNPLLKNQSQPDQKMYLDFNIGPPENSWEITEPAIYYQAVYIKLLSKFVPVP